MNVNKENQVYSKCPGFYQNKISGTSLTHPPLVCLHHVGDIRIVHSNIKNSLKKWFPEINAVLGHSSLFGWFEWHVPIIINRRQMHWFDKPALLKTVTEKTCHRPRTGGFLWQKRSVTGSCAHFVEGRPTAWFVRDHFGHRRSTARRGWALCAKIIC